MMAMWSGGHSGVGSYSGVGGGYSGVLGGYNGVGATVEWGDTVEWGATVEWRGYRGVGGYEWGLKWSDGL